MKEDSLEHIFRDKLYNYSSPVDKEKIRPVLLPFNQTGSGIAGSWIWLSLSIWFLLMAVIHLVWNNYYDTGINAFKYSFAETALENSETAGQRFVEDDQIGLHSGDFPGDIRTNIPERDQFSMGLLSKNTAEINNEASTGSEAFNTAISKPDVLQEERDGSQLNTQQLSSLPGTEESLQTIHQTHPISAPTGSEEVALPADIYLPVPKPAIPDLAFPADEVDQPEEKLFTPADNKQIAQTPDIQSLLLPDSDQPAISPVDLEPELEAIEPLPIAPDIVVSISAKQDGISSDDLAQLEVITQPADLKRFHFISRIGFHAGFPGRVLQSENPEMDALLSLRNESETPLLFYGGNLMGGIRHSSGWYLTSGISFIRLEERFIGEHSSIVNDTIPNGITSIFINALNDTIVNHGALPVVHHVNVKRIAYNSLSMFDLPLIAGYRFGTGNWSLEAETGFFYNIRFSQDGTRFDEQGDFELLHKSTAFASSTGLSFHGAFRLNYSFYAFSVSLAVVGRYFPGAVHTEFYDIRETYRLHGLELSLSHSF